MPLIHGDHEAWATMTDAEKQRLDEGHARFADAAGSAIITGHELAASTAATTIRARGGDKPIVTDGPFTESKEVVGGVYVIDVADIAAAVRLASMLPETRAPYAAGVNSGQWSSRGERRTNASEPARWGTPAEFFYSGETRRRRPVGDTDAWARRGSNPRPADQECDFGGHTSTCVVSKPREINVFDDVRQQVATRFCGQIWARNNALRRSHPEMGSSAGARC
jgi:hypothetical protein